MRRSSTLVSLVIITLVALLLAFTSTLLPLNRAVAAEREMSVAAMSPELRYPGQDLTLSVTLSAPITESATVEVRLEQEYATAFEQLKDYLDGVEHGGLLVYSQTIEPSEVEKDGDGARFTLTIPAGALGTDSPGGAGPRGMEVRLSSAHMTLDTRTLMMDGTDEFPETKIGVLGIDRTGTLSAPSLPGVSVASPSLDAAVQLPAEGADRSLLASIGAQSLLALADSTLKDPQTTPVIASSEGFSAEGVAALQPSTIIAPVEWSAERTLVTPSARIEMEGATLIDQWEVGTELLNEPAGEPSQELVLRQQLRAVSMWVGLEDLTDQRTLFSTIPLTIETSAARLEALLDSPWVHPISFEDVMDSTPSTVTRPGLPPVEPAARLAEAVLAPLIAEYELAQGVAEATQRGPSLLSEYENSILAATAEGLTEKERTRLVLRAVESLQDVTQMVEAIPIGTINVVNNSANFPVSVRNNGSTPISVEVQLVPSDPRLQAKKAAYASIPANSQIDVSIPVTAVGYGDVEAKTVVSTPNGTVLDESQVVEVRVRAGWEDTGTRVVLSLFALLFIFGVIRTINKRRKRKGASS